MSRSNAALRRCLFFVLVPFSACTALSEFNSVEVARTALLGLTQQDLRMCAGFPSRTEDEGNVSIWSYETDNRSAGLSLSAPILFGAGSTSLALPSGGSCHAQFRFVNGRVDRLSYAGNNDGPGGRDSRCTPVVDDCLTYVQKYGRGSPPAPEPKQAPVQAYGPETGR